MEEKQKIITLFEMVRDIPYGYLGSRNPLQVIKNNKGTCSGKHLLLGYLYRSLGINVIFMMCSTKLNYLINAVPNELKIILSSNEIYDYHNYLRICIDKKWIDLDITFDLPLARYGFPVNQNWDGTCNCEIALMPIERYEVNDLIKEKKIALNKLPHNMLKARIEFIKKLSNWMQKIRHDKSTNSCKPRY